MLQYTVDILTAVRDELSTVTAYNVFPFCSVASV